MYYQLYTRPRHYSVEPDGCLPIDPTAACPGGRAQVDLHSLAGFHEAGRQVRDWKCSKTHAQNAIDLCTRWHLTL